VISDVERLRLLTPEEATLDVPDVEELFGPHGPVARALGRRYRYRPQQIEMAQAVRQALIEGRPALIEAGTGSGKSFAYLIPVIASGARAFISTANKTLQTQLWEKDLPTLRKALSQRFTAALLKGRANYVCLAKLREAGRQLGLPGLRAALADLWAELQRVPSGDVEELRLNASAREAVTASQHECLGRECPFFAECYFEQAKAQAETADVVVLNHALLMVNLLRPFLTPRPVIVVDEAHELERYAINALRLELEYATVPALVNDEAVMRSVEERLRQDAVQLNNRLFVGLAAQPDEMERRWTVTGELDTAAALAHDLHAIAQQLQRAYPPAPGNDEENTENAHHQAVMFWAEELADNTLRLAQPPPPDSVRYCEARPGAVGADSVVLVREPLDVAGFLQASLFGPVKRVICTGATLTVEGRFDYFRRQTGAPLEPAIERSIDSPFDYATHALLYTPEGLEPAYGVGEEEYARALAREVWRLLQASRGRAFVLCTSHRRMNELYGLISPHLEYTCLCQGEGLARAELLERFQSEPGGAVLFATRSFWEGVDIPGAALSLVVIDKLPFSAPRDPVTEGRQALIRARGGDPFNELLLPEAILALKQGVGRLIRSEADRGVMAILDSRILTRGYGARILGSLPPARRTCHIRDVRAFFAADPG
jgi:Rad3-related DNA helicase